MLPHRTEYITEIARRTYFVFSVVASFVSTTEEEIIIPLLSGALRIRAFPTRFLGLVDVSYVLPRIKLLEHMVVVQAVLAEFKAFIAQVEGASFALGAVYATC